MLITAIRLFFICLAGTLFFHTSWADCDANHLVLTNKLGKWVVVEQLQKDHQNNIKDFRMEPLEILELTGQHLKFEVHNSYSATICIVEVDTHCDAASQKHNLNVLFGDSCHQASVEDGEYNLEIAPH